MKLDSLYSLLFLGLIAIVCTAAMMPAQGHTRKISKAAKCKISMKQIGTEVYYYFKDNDLKIYPTNPETFEVDEYILQSKKSSTWLELNLNSPYYFFCNEKRSFTGGANAPLATNWDPVKERDKEYLFVVWEDGHVSHTTKEEQARLINKSFNGLLIKLYRDLTFQTNPIDL